MTLDRDYHRDYMALYAEVTTAMDTLLDAFVMGAGGFTCQEADALYELLNFLAMENDAQVFLEAHSESDRASEGDRHTKEGDTR